MYLENLRRYVRPDGPSIEGWPDPVLLVEREFNCQLPDSYRKCLETFPGGALLGMSAETCGVPVKVPGATLSMYESEYIDISTLTGLAKGTLNLFDHTHYVGRVFFEQRLKFLVFALTSTNDPYLISVDRPTFGRVVFLDAQLAQGPGNVDDHLYPLADSFEQFIMSWPTTRAGS